MKLHLMLLTLVLFPDIALSQLCSSFDRAKQCKDAGCFWEGSGVCSDGSNQSTPAPVASPTAPPPTETPTPTPSSSNPGPSVCNGLKSKECQGLPNECSWIQGSCVPLPTPVASQNPSSGPSIAPSVSSYPSLSPSAAPSSGPSPVPSAMPTPDPSQIPSVLPTKNQSLSPSETSSSAPSPIPSATASSSPSQIPSVLPTSDPSPFPSSVPSFSPTSTNRFNLQLMDMGQSGTDARYVQAFEDARLRWQSIIRDDLPDFREASVYGLSDWFAGAFSQPYTGPIDDVVIGYEIGTIDGLGGILGQAGPRFATGGRTLSGVMLFEAVDFDRYDENEVRAIILHEMGHVLGLVGLYSGCRAGCNTITFEYQCTIAKTEYSALTEGGTLLLENDGSNGTVCSHFEEDNFRTATSSELMTGFFEANLGQPLSRVTIGALDDLNGYGVLNYDEADEWPAPLPTRRTQNTEGKDTSTSSRGPKWEIYRPSHSFFLPDLMRDLEPPIEVTLPNASKKNLRG